MIIGKNKTITTMLSCDEPKIIPSSFTRASLISEILRNIENEKLDNAYTPVPVISSLRVPRHVRSTILFLTSTSTSTSTSQSPSTSSSPSCTRSQRNQEEKRIVFLAKRNLRRLLEEPWQAVDDCTYLDDFRRP